MIAISSYRPLDQSYTCRDRQLRAKASWDPVFEEILYYTAESEPLLTTPQTSFMIGPGFPSIKTLASMAAASLASYVAILNADIMVNHRLVKVGHQLLATGIPVATSRRWTFYADPEQARVLPGDYGLDIFVAKPEVWRRTAQDMPETFLLGHPGWDEWLLRYFHKEFGRLFRHFTAHRCVLHEFHTERSNLTPLQLPVFNSNPPYIDPL